MLGHDSWCCRYSRRAGCRLARSGGRLARDRGSESSGQAIKQVQGNEKVGKRGEAGVRVLEPAAKGATEAWGQCNTTLVREWGRGTVGI